MAKAAAKQQEESNVVELRKNGPAVDAHTVVNLGKMKRSADELASKMGQHRNVLKHVEGQGINLKAAKRAMSIIKSGKKDEWLEETARVTEYLYAFGDGVEEAQMSFDYLLNSAMPSAEKARMLGRNAGLRGDGTGENPYAPGSEQANEWLNGFHDGTRERAVAEAESEGDEVIKGSDDDVFDDEDEDEGED